MFLGKLWLEKQYAHNMPLLKYQAAEMWIFYLEKMRLWFPKSLSDFQ